MDNEPDQIDQMSEAELRAEFRKVAAENAKMREALRVCSFYAYMYMRKESEDMISYFPPTPEEARGHYRSAMALLGLRVPKP